MTDDTDFFGAGAGSMHVVQLVEEVKDRTGLAMRNEDVFMNTSLKDFVNSFFVVRRYRIRSIKKLFSCEFFLHFSTFARGGAAKEELAFDAVRMHANKMDLTFPRQLYIDGRFVDGSSGKRLKLFNPNDESLICEVETATKADVDKAVAAAEKAFAEGEWSKMSARERGNLLYK